MLENTFKKGIELKYYHSLIYLLFILSVFLINNYLSHPLLVRIISYTMYAVYFLLMVYFLNELQAYLKYFTFLQKTFFSIRFLNFQTMDFFSIIIALVLSFLEFYLRKPWYVSDIISTLIIGALMKLMKFKRMKEAVYFLLICLLSDCILAGVFHFTNSQCYDTVIIDKYNSPILF